MINGDPKDQCLDTYYCINYLYEEIEYNVFLPEEKDCRRGLR